MPSRRQILASAPFLFVSAASAQEHHHHDFGDIDRWVSIFEEPGREKWQKPREVVDWLAPQPHSTVADVGAASGYFSRAFAHKLSKGWSIAVEIEPGFFKPIHQLAQKEGLRNVLTQLCPADGPGLPADSVDCIFLCDTLHHITPRPTYFQEVRRCLRRGGSLALVEYFPDRELPFGPKKSERLDPALVSEELRQAGFRVRLNDQLLPYQYVIQANLPES